MKKKNIENIVLVLFVVLIVGGLLFTIFKTQNETKDMALEKNLESRKLNDAQRYENLANSGDKMKSTGSTGSGDVAIDIEPKEFIDGKFILEISLNTHSVDMNDFDLTKMIILKFESKEFAPISAPVLSGHHNSGELVFELEKRPESFSIEIIGIPAVDKRVFNWEK
jgi:hypothetical protein